jgi:hypothetical protein
MFAFVQRPHHVELTGSRPITEVKQHWARLVLRWVTAWEYRVSLFFLSATDFFLYSYSYYVLLEPNEIFLDPIFVFGTSPGTNIPNFSLPGLFMPSLVSLWLFLIFSGPRTPTKIWTPYLCLGRPQGPTYQISASQDYFEFSTI